jgi:hypothetical protein
MNNPNIPVRLLSTTKSWKPMFRSAVQPQVFSPGTRTVYATSKPSHAQVGRRRQSGFAQRCKRAAVDGRPATEVEVWWWAPVESEDTGGLLAILVGCGLAGRYAAVGLSRGQPWKQTVDGRRGIAAGRRPRSWPQITVLGRSRSRAQLSACSGASLKWF